MHLLLISYNDTVFKNIVKLDKDFKVIYKQKWDNETISKPDTIIEVV